MSQILASTRLPVPNVLLPKHWLGDHGALYIRTGQTWHVWGGAEWTAYSTRELYKTHKYRPPSNVEDGWAGIAPGPFEQNWTKKDLTTAFTTFMHQHKNEYIPADGCCWDPLKKARLLRRDQDRRVARGVPDHLIFKAKPELPAPVSKQLVY